jgi:uncharacterized protein YjbJ (UPF0337 family)
MRLPISGNRIEKLQPPHEALLIKTKQESIMNWDQVQGNWKQVKGQVKQQWGKLTDDDLERIEGKRDELAGIIQTRYGYAKEQAEKEIDRFCQSCTSC